MPMTSKLHQPIIYTHDINEKKKNESLEDIFNKVIKDLNRLDLKTSKVVLPPGGGN